MRALFILFLLLLSALTVKPACLTVFSLTPQDEDHYVVDWKNGCNRTLDAVYVVVDFTAGGESTGSGVFPLYFVQPRARKLTRFTVPPMVRQYDKITVRRIVATLEEALQ